MTDEHELPIQIQEMSLSPPDLLPFCLSEGSEDARTTAQRWQEWKKGFNDYIFSSGVTLDAEKMGLLTQFGGSDVRAVLEMVPESIPVDSFQKAIDLLTFKFGNEKPVTHSSPKWKVFNDAVHGSIDVHPLCVRIIDTPQFQRLRFIEQTGTVFFVYPSSSHSRFEHSLGVYHLARQLVIALRDQQPELQITEEDILCVQIAALCHDLGHGPFSHLWETFMKQKRPQHNWKHEELSVDLLDYLIESNHLQGDFQAHNLHKEDIFFIKEMIDQKRAFEGDPHTTWPFKGRPSQKGFLYQIVSNSTNGVDVDKWDYYLRDAHSLGIKVTFNYSRLIKFSRVLANPTAQNGQREICFRDKEEINLYEMFHTRMMLHKKAYQHRVVKILDVMLVDAFSYANDFITYGPKNLPLCDVVDDLEAVTYLKDDIIHQIERHSSTDEKMVKAKEIVSNLMKRRYYPCVGYSPPITSDLKLENVHALMKRSRCLGDLLERNVLVVQVIELNYSKKANPVNKVGFFSKEQPNIFKVHSTEGVAKMFPLQWGLKVVFAVSRSYEDNIVREARKAFSSMFS